ncbi:MAG: hypothetical protein HGB19_11715, partial [Chlorobiales bacterium]|nr:hypothetical protein [Chlorobiales bacterium]
MFPHLEFSLSHPWVSAVFILAALGIAVYTYQSAAISKPMKSVLITLRSAALFLTFLLILEPVLSTIYTKRQPPTLAVLADNSESMTIQDGSVRRDSILRHLLTNNRDSLTHLGEIQPILFGKSPINAPFDSLSFSQKQTDISEAIKSVGKGKGEKKPSAILLISDGQFTAGENPIYASESAPVPIYTVLIGDTTKKRD